MKSLILALSVALAVPASAQFALYDAGSVGSPPVAPDPITQGWTLTDPTKRTWKLDSLGILAPGAEKTFTRGGEPMGMNNGGDTILLVNPSGGEVQVVTYGPVAEGEIVTVSE